MIARLAAWLLGERYRPLTRSGAFWTLSRAYWHLKREDRRLQTAHGYGARTPERVDLFNARCVLHDLSSDLRGEPRGNTEWLR